MAARTARVSRLRYLTPAAFLLSRIGTVACSAIAASQGVPAVEVSSGSMNQIATAIAAARGALLIASQLGREDSGAGRAEPSLDVAATKSSSTVDFADGKTLVALT